MRRFQKAFYALAAVVVLGWASTASAQVTFFVSASSARQIRGEGLAEATGVVAFAANSGGTIVLGSAITLDYGTLVSSSGDSTFAAPLPCSGTVNFNGAAAGFITKTCIGNVVTLTFNAGQAFVPGDSLTISGTRVNANALGSGANVNVSAGATVPAASQATNPVTLVVFTALTVATVQAAPATLVKLTPVQGASILFCQVIAEAAGPSFNLNQSVQLDITENFASAFTSRVDENGLGVNGAGGLLGATQHVNFRFRISNIPLGVSVTIVGPLAGTTAGLTIALPGTVTFKSSAADNEVDFDVSLTATNTNAIENLTMRLDFFVTDISDAAFPKVEGTANLRITFRSRTDPPEAPIFSETGSARQYNGPILRTLACATFLLFPWVAYTGDGAVDTGLAIANTTKDPPQIGTVSQKGDVTLHFWRATGTNHPAPVKIATALEGGNTATYVISQLGSPFSGYVIAVCGFQMGHGIAAFLSGGSFNAFLAISLDNPRLAGGAVTEHQGH